MEGIKELIGKIKQALSAEKGGEEAAIKLAEEFNAGLEAKRTELLTETKQAKAKLRAYEALGDVKELEGLAAEVEQLREAQKKGSVDVQEAVKKVELKYTKEVEKLDTALKQERAVVTRLVVENGLTAELVKAGVTEAGMKYARAHFLPQVTLEGEGEERVAKIGQAKLPEAVAAWAKTEEAKLFLRAGANAGGGASGGAGGSTGAKTMPRAEFDKLDPAAKMAFAKEGGQVVAASA
jgi:hypothetical protein